MEPSSPELLCLRSVSHAYRGAAADGVLRNISFSLEQGASLALLGPSGCGKSTLLQICCGLLQPREGQCLLNGRSLKLPSPEIAMVLQHYGLFPWKTVGQNIELGLRLRGGAIDRGHIRGLLSELGITGRESDYPGQLSGGQQQRVALARALVLSPALLLLDEPFGALDSLTRERLQDLLRSLWMRSGFAMLTVTHSMAEAAMLGERILVMEGEPGHFVSVIDNPGMRSPAHRDSPEYLAVLQRLRSALGEAG